MMRKEYLTREEAAVVGGVRITPIVRILVRYTKIKGVWSFYVGKQPVYLIISSGDGERAYNITGQEVSIQQVISDCPALLAGLEGRSVPRFPPH